MKELGYKMSEHVIGILGAKQPDTSGRFHLRAQMPGNSVNAAQNLYPGARRDHIIFNRASRRQEQHSKSPYRSDQQTKNGNPFLREQTVVLAPRHSGQRKKN